MFNAQLQDFMGNPQNQLLAIVFCVCVLVACLFFLSFVFVFIPFLPSFLVVFLLNICLSLSYPFIVDYSLILGECSIHRHPSFAHTFCPYASCGQVCF